MSLGGELSLVELRSEGVRWLDGERFAVTLVVLVGGGVLLVLLRPDTSLQPVVTALWGLSVGWWLPRNGNGSSGAASVVH